VLLNNIKPAEPIAYEYHQLFLRRRACDISPLWLARCGIFVVSAGYGKSVNVNLNALSKTLVTMLIVSARSSRRTSHKASAAATSGWPSSSLVISMMGRATAPADESGQALRVRRVVGKEVRLLPLPRSCTRAHHLDCPRPRQPQAASFERRARVTICASELPKMPGTRSCAWKPGKLYVSVRCFALREVAMAQNSAIAHSSNASKHSHVIAPCYLIGMINVSHRVHKAEPIISSTAAFGSKSISKFPLHLFVQSRFASTMVSDLPTVHNIRCISPFLLESYFCSGHSPLPNNWVSPTCASCCWPATLQFVPPSLY